MQCATLLAEDVVDRHYLLTVNGQRLFRSSQQCAPELTVGFASLARMPP